MAFSSETPQVRRTYAAVQDPKPEAVIIHCSDPRFQPAFAQFIEHELRLMPGEFIPIVVGGGAGVLGHPEQLPKEFKFLKERLEHYRRVFPSVRRIILINHENCRYYESIKSRVLCFMGSRVSISPEHARNDLPLVSQVFRRFLSHLGFSVELYYAHFANDDRDKVVFDKILAT